MSDPIGIRTINPRTGEVIVNITRDYPEYNDVIADYAETHGYEWEYIYPVNLLKRSEEQEYNAWGAATLNGLREDALRREYGRVELNASRKAVGPLIRIPDTRYPDPRFDSSVDLGTDPF